MSAIRDKSIDFVKGAVIYLVVWGHVLQHIHHNHESSLAFNIIYSFHMPLFIFISGYFAAHTLNKSIKEVAKKVWKRLLVPALIWSCVQFVKLLLTGFSRGPASMIVNSFRDKWFLYCVAFLYVLGCVVFKAGRWKYVVAVSLVVFGYAVYKVPGVVYIEYFQPIRQWPLFVMGFAYYEYKQKCESKLLPRNVAIFSMLIYSGLMLWLASNHPIGYIKTHENYLPRAVIYQTGAITWFLLFTMLYQVVEKCPHSGDVVSSLGRNTMGIYVIHGKILLLMILLMPYNVLTRVPSCITAIVLMAVSYYATLLVKKSPRAAKYLLGE